MDNATGQERLLLENTPPFPIEARFGFCCCIASLMRMDSDEVLEGQQKELAWWYAYQTATVTSGMGVGLLYSEGNEHYADLDVHACVPDEAYIPYGMAAGGYTYRTVDCPAVGEAETRRVILESLARGRPVLAEGLVGPGWSLITGYEQGGDMLLGYAPYRRTHYPRPYRPDRFGPHWLFYKSRWYVPLRRLLVIEGTDAPPRPAQEYFRLWARVLRGGRRGTLTWGMEAWQSLITRLRNAPLWDRVDDMTLKVLYEPFSLMCNLPQSRGSLGAMLDDRPGRRQFRRWLGVRPWSMTDWRLDLVKVNANSQYTYARQCMQAISETTIYEPHPGAYAERLRRPGVQRSALAYLDQMRRWDAATLYSLERAAQSEEL